MNPEQCVLSLGVLVMALLTSPGAHAQVGKVAQVQATMDACIKSPAMPNMPFENGRLRSTPEEFCSCFVVAIEPVNSEQALAIRRSLTEDMPPPDSLGEDLLSRIRAAGDACQVAPPIDPLLPFAERFALACKGSPDLLPELKDEIADDATVPERFCSCLAAKLDTFSPVHQALLFASVSEADKDNEALMRQANLQEPTKVATMAYFRSENPAIPEGWDE